MTKTKKAAENVQSWTKQMAGNEQGHKLVGEQMATAWSAEDKFVGELHDYMERWCGRRHEAAQATIDYAHKLANGADQSEITKAWSGLTSATMKRLTEDAQEQFKLAQKMTTAMMTGFQGGGGSLLPMMTTFGQQEQATNASDDYSEKGSE